MSKPVVITHKAEQQILELDAWWRVHREKAPDKFEDELEFALQMIATMPGAGKRYPHAEADVRRILLRSTRNHVYYVEQEERVLVVAVWGAVKGSGPDLSMI